MDMLTRAIKWIGKQAGDGGRFKNTLKMAEFLELDEKKRIALYNALKEGGSTPSSTNLMMWLEGLGAQLVFPGEEQTTAGAYQMTSFERELHRYLNGLIALHRKSIESVSAAAAGGDEVRHKRLERFLKGSGPMWVGDLPYIARALGQAPDHVVQTVETLVNESENAPSIQQTLAS